MSLSIKLPKDEPTERSQKTNHEEHLPDPEVEILRSKIEAMQTEMKMIKIGLSGP
jgi:hypothetical protein